MVQRLTSKPWFGPKKYFGWGWSPRSWEGWVTTAVFVALAVTAVSVIGGAGRYIGLIVVVAVFAVVMLLTGTPPGSPGNS